jgi:hypothetical protein
MTSAAAAPIIAGTAKTQVGLSIIKYRRCRQPSRQGRKCGAL